MKKSPEYVSVTAASKALRASRVTIYKWIAVGRLDATEIAGRTVIIVNPKYRSAKP
jgi:excisionase family DNA binding protein